MTQCKYYDCGFCCAPDDVITNSTIFSGLCTEPENCPYPKLQMTENRTPIQIAGNLVLCEDKTIWKYDGAWWVKLAPIPTDEEYEVLKQERLEWEREWMEAQTKQGGWSRK